MKKSARYTAVQALIRQSSTDGYSNLLMDGLCAKNQLDARDASFATAIFYGTLERRITLDHILKKYCSKPLDQLSAAVLEILRVGVYQLLYLDGVDDYAAVSESVNLAKAFQCAKASGFVNGVLRSFLRDEKKIPPVKGGDVENLSIQYSCPAWLISRWIQSYGKEACVRMLEASLGRPPIYLRANTTKISTKTLAEGLQRQGIDCTVDPTLEGCIAVSGRIVVEKLPAFEQGFFHVQDRASQICAASLDAKPGMRVLDVCAAPGGKSFSIAQWMQDQGEIVARDLHEKRALLVQQGAQRLGLSCIKASSGDAGRFDAALGLFDRVLCDVPCSGFGIIRRKPEIKYKPPTSVQNLPEIQYKILKTSAQYLKEGGKLIYSTCTLLPEENEQVAARFLEESPNFQMLSQHTYTGEDGDTDGFFVCVIEKQNG